MRTPPDGGGVEFATANPAYPVAGTRHQGLIEGVLTMFLGLLRRGPRRPNPRRSPRGPWTLVRLEDRTVPATISYATGAGPGGGPQVNVYDNTGTLLTAFNAYPGFSGGVQV